MHITKKIEAARALFDRWGGALLEDREVAARLSGFTGVLEASRAASLQSGIVAICGRCDREEGGSCCGAGIENRYTPELLLINLLLGIEPAEQRKYEKSCHFLGGEGCLLKVRDIICINYLCAGARTELGDEGLLSLQSATGQEMEKVFVLHDLVRKRIRRWNG